MGTPYNRLSKTVEGCSDRVQVRGRRLPFRRDVKGHGRV